MNIQMKRMGFTLIELLFVVAVIAVLAAISVPNFLEAQVRAKISRTHSDMAVVEQGLRSYYADYNTYPRHRPEVHDFLEACSRVELADARSLSQPADARYSWTHDDPLVSTRPGNHETMMCSYTGHGLGLASSLSFPILVPAAWDLMVLTTPVAYVGTALPVDNFHNLKGTPYTYINLSELETTSTEFRERAGAFRRYILLSYGPDTDSHQTHWVNPVRGPWTNYDATNGTVSVGDVLTFGNGDAGLTSSPLDLSNPAPPQRFGYGSGAGEVI